MVYHDTPYEFGDMTIDGGLGDDQPPEGCENGTDVVFVDGDAMSFRSYKKAEKRET